MYFEVRVGKVLPSFRVKNLTSRGIPVGISNWELRNSSILGHMETHHEHKKLDCLKVFSFFSPQSQCNRISNAVFVFLFLKNLVDLNGQSGRVHTGITGFQFLFRTCCLS